MSSPKTFNFFWIFKSKNFEILRSFVPQDWRKPAARTTHSEGSSFQRDFASLSCIENFLISYSLKCFNFYFVGGGAEGVPFCFLPCHPLPRLNFGGKLPKLFLFILRVCIFAQVCVRVCMSVCEREFLWRMKWANGLIAIVLKPIKFYSTNAEDVFSDKIWRLNRGVLASELEFRLQTLFVDRESFQTCWSEAAIRDRHTIIEFR